MKSLSFANHGLQLLPPKQKLEYSPITQGRGIRLVRLLPGSKLDGIQCEIEHANLDDLPSYVALSYCWGLGTNKTWLSCNKQRCDITRDLLKALHRFRQKDKIVTLWIDQICINQANIQERNNQVSLMRDIYKQAEGVFIWLGDGDADTALAIRCIQRVNEVIGDSEQCVHDKGTELWQKGLPKSNSKEWKALASLLARPWFGRMWILQEMAVASSATIVYGQNTIPWTDFFDSIVRMARAYCLPENSAIEGADDVINKRLDNIITIKQEYLAKGHLNFWKALRLSSYSEAKDPRDKVFALLGLCVQNQFTQVDYSKDIVEVYRDAALRILFGPGINSHGVMLFLSDAEKHRSSLPLPSWVPDWTVQTPIRTNSISLLQLEGPKVYKAAGSSTVKVSRTDKLNRISLAGKLCDAVLVNSSIAPAFVPSGPMRRNATEESVLRYIRPLYPWILESSSIATVCHRYADESAREIAYSHTLSGNVRYCPGTSCATSSHRADVTDHFDLCYWHFRQWLAKMFPGGVVNGAPIRQLEYILSPHQERFNHFMLSYILVAENRRYFATLGGYMGVGPPGMQPGDVVCVFLGGRVPWVIRQMSESSYILVGECYVHGLMDGEVMATQHLPIQEIILQ